MKESVLKPHLPFQSAELKDAELVVKTLLDCIKTDDIESIRDVLIAHLMTVNESEISQKFHIL